MKKILLLFVLASSFWACNTEQNTTASTIVTDEATTSTTTATTDFYVALEENAELDFEQLRLYPIMATPEFVAAQADLANVQNLAEGMQNTRFRITEKKAFGDRNNSGDVNNLTVQNKTEHPVYLMAGDVIKGGRQDRVIAEDMLAMPRTIQDISVFCVEKGRWYYQDDAGNEVEVPKKVSEQQKKIMAFTGYYNVASNDLRRTVKETKNQQAVWAKVDDVRKHFSVDAGTAYTELETARDFTGQRDEYIAFYSDKFSDTDNVIGIVAVSGNKILGADIFGHPNLFKKQYQSLLHSYVAEAMAKGSAKREIDAEKVRKFVLKLEANYAANRGGKDAKFTHDGKVVHYTSF